jgi:protein-S-isoprenylcysteine O-methyltransferase Ste14
MNGPSQMIALERIRERASNGEREQSQRPVGRLSWYLRVVPAAFLAVLYLLIATSKGLAAAGGLRDILDGTHGAAQAVRVLHYGSGVLFFAILGVMMFVRKEPIRRERRLVGWVLPFAVMAILAFVGGAPVQDHGTAVMVVATLFVVTGTAFTIYALRHLGRHFGVVSDVRGLVTSGPYRWVRHPLYAGETLTIIGLVLAVATPFTIAVFAAGMTFQIIRARVEEQALTAAFPEYTAYAARTPMLIPLSKW